MNRRYLAAVAVLLILLLPVAALAEGESPAPQPTIPQPTIPQPTATTVPVSLAIDNKNVYDGMATAYQDGYMPKVNKGMATLVLPLVANGALMGSVITVTPQLGEPETSPFIYMNYQKSVALANNTVNGGAATVPSYLVQFDLPLKAGRVDGAYPVAVAVQAEAADGTPVQATFTSYVTITDGKDPNATPAPEVPKPQSKVIISASSVEPSPVTAGQAFTAKVTLSNISEDTDVQGLTVTASCDSPDITLLAGSATQFVGKLGEGETKAIELKYNSSLKAAEQSYNITLALDYEGAGAMALTATSTVPVTIVQVLRVKLDTPKIAAEVNAGDTLPLSFQVMNMGRGTVYNVRCELAAPGLLPIAMAFIGNLEAGTARTGGMDVFVGTKDMSEGYTGNDKYGPTDGNVTLIYEDESGKEYREETKINTTINAPAAVPVSQEPEVAQPKPGQWWVTIAAGCTVAAGLILYLIMRGRRRVKRHEGA